VSLHLIEDEKIDAGPVLVQRARALDRTRSVGEITTVLLEDGATLVLDAVKAFQEGQIAAQQSAAASYRGFPDRTDMARARQRRVRLFRFRLIAHLLAAAVG
jgi:methionyl-tRNA formyltransferase